MLQNIALLESSNRSSLQLVNGKHCIVAFGWEIGICERKEEALGVCSLPVCVILNGSAPEVREARSKPLNVTVQSGYKSSRQWSSVGAFALKIVSLPSKMDTQKDNSGRWCLFPKPRVHIFFPQGGNGRVYMRVIRGEVMRKYSRSDVRKRMDIHVHSSRGKCVCFYTLARECMYTGKSHSHNV